MVGLGLLANPQNAEQDLSLLDIGNTVSPPNNESEIFASIKKLVEDNITEIISSPLQSSNPEDYLKA